jgi:muconolactone delta-isomerase
MRRKRRKVEIRRMRSWDRARRWRAQREEGRQMSREGMRRESWRLVGGFGSSGVDGSDDEAEDEDCRRGIRESRDC